MRITKKISRTCQTSTSVLILLLILPDTTEGGIQGKFKLPKPNICLRCDLKGGKKVKPCPADFNQPNLRDNIELIECGYQKPICGITLNVTDKPTVIYSGCYSKKFKRHCFKDRVRQYGAVNTSYCYHTCTESLLCNPYESWLKEESSLFNLFKIIG